MSLRRFCSARRLLGGIFDTIDAELELGICDKLPLLEGFATETVQARWSGA
jgi:hypothetical protein